VSRGRLEQLQWFGLLAGPLAFAVWHVLAVGLTLANCNPAGNRWGVPQHTLIAVLMAVAALVVVLGQGAAVLAFRETRGVDWEGDPPLGRIRFLATAALLVGPLFLALVLLGGIGALAHADCHQA
jgi:hypothetical protein